MKNESLEFQEIFGASTIMESIDSVAPVLYKKPEPQLPMDGDPFWLENVTGGRSADADRIADDAFVIEISGCESSIHGSGTAQATTQARLDLLKLLQTANARSGALSKRASAGLTRAEIAAKMTKYYSHSVWRGWERMMQSCIGDAEFSEQKALSFLR
jgi:hypothetical protein